MANVEADIELSAGHSKGIVLYEVSHIVQKESWDCGLTCIMMILPHEKADALSKNLNTICKEELVNQSTWTIDLCYVLQHFSVSHKYHTKTVGVNAAFAKEKFYNSYIPRDEERVNQRFRSASANGVHVENNPLKLDDILGHLERDGLAIILVDANHLDCQDCPSLVRNVGRFIGTMFHKKPAFLGHYILICGFDRNRKTIFYKDPAVRSALCRLSYDSFEKARLAHGTDEDIILVYR